MHCCLLYAVVFKCVARLGYLPCITSELSTCIVVHGEAPEAKWASIRWLGVYAETFWLASLLMWEDQCGKVNVAASHAAIVIEQSL